MKLSEVINNGYNFAGCEKCKYYYESRLENECKYTGDYCFPAHKMKQCEHFEESPIYIGDLKGE